jgi:hypothetical protein
VNHCYDDILTRIAEEPVWFDEHAVPRYCEFSPNKVANIYSNEAALVEVTCQHCRRLFRVAFSAAAKLSEWPAGPIGIKIREKTLHYGDPPNVRCCEAGPSTNSEPRKVIEYWREGDPAYTRVEAIGRTITDAKAYFTWARHSLFEIDIRPDWVDL